jgi:hypothetical protein
MVRGEPYVPAPAGLSRLGRLLFHWFTHYSRALTSEKSVAPILTIRRQALTSEKPVAPALFLSIAASPAALTLEKSVAPILTIRRQALPSQLPAHRGE